MWEVPGRGPNAGGCGWNQEHRGTQVCGWLKMVHVCLQRNLLLACVMCACVLVSELEGASLGQKVLEGPPGALGSPVTLLWTALLYASCTGKWEGLRPWQGCKLKVDVKGALWWYRHRRPLSRERGEWVAL